MQRIFLILFLLINTTQLSAQNLASDLQRLRTHYESIEQYAVTLKVTSITGKRNKAPEIHLEEVKMYKKGTSMLYETAMADRLQTDTLLLLVDKKHKRIYHNELKSAPKQLLKKVSPLQSIDSVLSRFSTVTFKGERNKRKTYLLQTQNGSIKQIEITINTQRQHIERVFYKFDEEVYGQPMSVEIVYQTDERATSFSEKIFLTENFIHGKVAAQKYTGYDIIYQ